MTQQIKERIKQIQNGGVPHGYKKTKVGIVPNEWELTSLHSCLNEYREMSNDINTLQVFSSSRKGLVPQSEYFDNKEAVETNLGYKVVPSGYITYRHMSDDDIFYFNTNTASKSILVSSEYPVFSISKIAIRNYIISLINHSTRFRYFCRKQKKGGTRTRLYFNSLCKFEISLPPLAEQEKIAQILSACDKSIELKTKIIEQKNLQKKWLMQNLLTGKKRLEGFTGEWKKVELGKVFDYEQPTQYLVKTTDYNNSFDTPVLTAGKTFILGYTNETKEIYTDLPVVIFDDFTTASKYVDFPFKIKSSAMKILKCRSEHNIVFMYGVMQELKYVVGGHERHWISKYSNIPIKVPPLPEQTAIAERLSTADKEIELLQKDLEAEKQKKKALMQLLLTGIVRIKV